MILGIEGIHTFRGFTLNNLREYPRARVESIPGLRAMPDFEALVDKAIGRVGEVPRMSDLGGKSITYEGILQARSQIELAEYVEELLYSFTYEDEARMAVSPHPDDPTVGLPDRFYFARPIEASVPVEYAEDEKLHRITRGWECPFSIVLRLTDPRYYWADSELTVEDTTPAATGGLGVPYTPGGHSASPSDQGFTISVDNDGTADVDAEFEMHGPIRNPVLVNQTTEKFLRFKGLIIPADGQVNVDFRKRRVRRGNGDNVRHTLDPSSTWWDRGVKCLPARSTNSIRLKGYEVDAGAKLVINHNPADYS